MLVVADLPGINGLGQFGIGAHWNSDHKGAVQIPPTKFELSATKKFKISLTVGNTAKFRFTAIRTFDIT